MTQLAWGAKVSPVFRKKVRDIADALGCDPSWLMACMAFETGRTFSPSIWNQVNHKFVGLIQFGPDAATDLGTTTQELAAKTPEEQLDDVYHYLRKYADRGLHTLADLYMAILMPSAIGKPLDAPIITSEQGKAYIQNKGLDLNQDGNITKAEATALVQKQLNEGMQPGNAWDVDAQAPAEDSTTTGGVMAGTDPLTAIAGIAGMFNPMAGGIIGLAGQLIKTFAPNVQGKIEKEIGRHDDVDSKLAAIAQFAQTLVGQAQVLTKQPDPFDAVAAAKQDVAIKAQLEETTEQRMDALAKAADKTIGYDQSMWAAQNAGKQQVSTIAIEEKKAGLWDMTRVLVWMATITTTVGSFLLLITILIQSLTWAFMKDAKGIDTALIAFAAPLLTMAYQGWKDIMAYRFDGTKESSAQTNALLNAATKKVAP